MKVNIDLSVCRICLQASEDDMKSIFEEDENNLTISMKIESCGGIKISKNYEFPTMICKKCHAFLSIAHKFRIICQNSDDYLHEFVSKGDTSYEDEETIETLDIKPLSRIPTTKTEYQKVSKEELDDKDAIDSDYSYEELKDNGAYSDDDSEVEQKPTVKPRKTLSMGEDGTAVIKTNKKQTHICEVCGNTYQRRYCLEAHMRRHRGEKPFECEICKKAFALNFQLTRHMRSHTGARPYKCQYCDRTFADRSTNVKHERIHTNERPYKCESCGKSFTYSNVLKVHMMTHTGEKPFTCDLCGKRFSQLHHLRAHLQTLQHQNDPQATKLLLKSEPL
ncbi:zinc finger protein ZFP2 [Episyrphus balteatus]|uniref:zinc finger protein ZFP2 n=1 Tax=Episyrphus balteatus TaxID=286459 RepID=UPI002485A35D|nr:zinc finger protein ZFP2 [Episyrphus balteatus]